MMETLRIFHILLAGAAFSISTAAGMEFKDIDSLATESVRLRSQTASEQRRWNSEKAEMLAEISALEETKKALQEEISRLEREIAESDKQTKIIRDKLSIDESAMAELDSFLSGKYDSLLKIPGAAEALAGTGLEDRKKFASKNALEKFSAVCEILKAIKAEDLQIDKSGGEISSGIFVRAFGSASGSAEVADLKVDRGGEKK